MDWTQMQVPELVLFSDFINTKKAQKKELGDRQRSNPENVAKKRQTNLTGKNETQWKGWKH